MTTRSVVPSRRTSSYACGVASLCLVAACTFRAYDGPSLSPSERATIEATSHTFEQVRITSIDGRHFPALANRAEVRPGFHYVAVTYQAQYGYVGYRGERDCVIEFAAEAERTYLIDYARRGNQWAAWLIDTTTGERIAECSWVAAPIRSWTPAPTATPKLVDS